MWILAPERLTYSLTHSVFGIQVTVFEREPLNDKQRPWLSLGDCEESAISIRGFHKLRFNRFHLENVPEQESTEDAQSLCGLVAVPYAAQQNNYLHRIATTGMWGCGDVHGRSVQLRGKLCDFREGAWVHMGLGILRNSGRNPSQMPRGDY